MGLSILSVPSGTNIFVDSNIFLYVFFKHPVYGKACHTFIKRIEENEVIGFVDEFVLNEVFHKLNRDINCKPVPLFSCSGHCCCKKDTRTPQ